MADLAKLVVRLEAQSSQLLAELDRANRGITGFATKTSREIKKWATGLASAYTIAQGIGFAKQSIDNADAMGDMAQAAGQTVEDFSRMAYAMKGANVEGQELVKVQTKLASQAVDAANGNKKAAEAFKRLGIDVKDANGNIKTSNELVLDAAEAFSQYADGPTKTAAAVELFGDKLAGKMIPFLNKGREGVEALMRESDKFGQTISPKAARAGDDFNDNLDRMAAIGRGVANTLVAELLPGLSAMAEEMVNGAGDMGVMDKAARGLAVALKILITGGMVIGEVFDRLGDAIGATAASLAAAAQGEFKQALDIQRDYWGQSKDSLQQTVDEINALWKTTGDKIANDAEQTDARVKRTLVFGGQAGGGIQEITIGAKKIETGAMQQFYDELNEMTKTSSELALSEYRRQQEAISLLYQEGIISLETYEARRQEAMDKLLPEFEVTVKKITETTASTISEFDKAVAQNTVGIISDALMGGFDEGARGILHSFAVMLQQLAAQALAAEIGKKIFGEAGGASGGGGGWWGMALKAAGSFFGGGAATGRDHVSAGTGLIVGENGPEKFVPDVPGRVMSAAEVAPQPQVNVPVQVVNVDDPNKIPSFFNSDKGRQTFTNMLTDNASAIRQILQGA